MLKGNLLFHSKTSIFSITLIIFPPLTTALTFSHSKYTKELSLAFSLSSKHFDLDGVSKCSFSFGGSPTKSVSYTHLTLQTTPYV